MNIEEIRELMDLIAMYPSIEEIEIEKNGTKIMMRRKQHKENDNNKRRAQEMTKEENSQSNVQCELEEVKAPVVGTFHYIVLDKNKEELKNGELEKIIFNGNNRIEIYRGFYVAQGQVLGTIIQLNIPFPVEAPCAGVIEEVFLVAGQENQQQSYPVGYGEILFTINKKFSLK